MNMYKFANFTTAIMKGVAFMGKKENKKVRNGVYICGSVALTALSFVAMPKIINKLTEVIDKKKSNQINNTYADEPEIIKIEKED